MWGGSYQIIPRQWQTVSSNRTIKFYSETSSDSGFGKQNVTFFFHLQKETTLLLCKWQTGSTMLPTCPGLWYAEHTCTSPDISSITRSFKQHVKA